MLAQPPTKTPTVTVIMPVHNGAQHLAESIDSVLAQSFSDLELIVVDDASTDETPDMLRRLGERDPRVRVITNTPASGGPSIPRNLGLFHARGEYVAFLDHDDYYAPEYIAELHELLRRNPHWMAAFCDLQLVSAAGEPLPGTYLSDASFQSHLSGIGRQVDGQVWELGSAFFTFMCLRYCALHTDSVMLARFRLLEDPVSFRARYRVCEDTDLWLRVARQGAIGFLDKPLSHYRQTGKGISSHQQLMLENTIEVHKENYLAVGDRLSKSDRRAYLGKISNYIVDLLHYKRLHGSHHDCMKLIQAHKGHMRVDHFAIQLMKSWVFQAISGLSARDSRS